MEAFAVIGAWEDSRFQGYGEDIAGKYLVAPGQT